MESTKETRKYHVAEIQLTYKSNVRPSLRPKISTSKDAYPSDSPELYAMIKLLPMKILKFCSAAE
jgi:hypothetical protein